MRTIDDFLEYVGRADADDLEYADICISLAREVIQVMHYCQLLIKHGKYDFTVQSLNDLQVYVKCLKDDNEDICEVLQYLLNCLEQSLEIDTEHMLEEFWDE